MEGAERTQLRTEATQSYSLGKEQDPKPNTIDNHCQMGGPLRPARETEKVAHLSETISFILGWDTILGSDHRAGYFPSELQFLCFSKEAPWQWSLSGPPPAPPWELLTRWYVNLTLPVPPGSRI